MVGIMVLGMATAKPGIPRKANMVGIAIIPAQTGTGTIANMVGIEVLGRWQCGACGWVDHEIAVGGTCTVDHDENGPIQPRTIFPCVAPKLHRWASEANDAANIKHPSVFRSRFIVGAGEEQYEIDVCVQHGETRARRVR